MDGTRMVAGADENTTTPPQGIIKKMSFASVVAMPRSNRLPAMAPSAQSGNSVNAAVQPTMAITPVESLTPSLARLDLHANGSGASDNLADSSKLDDDGTHVSFCSIKAPSIASGLASALDEKESIRPDDSASVQAAEDDDSGSGSGAQNSRLGSEAGAKAFHSQLREISAQRGLPYISKIDDRQPPPTSAFSYWMPDEKLIDALDSPKDRIFLLQLEQQIVAYIQSSTDAPFDLPPYNSFLRLLAHRLADYYKLSHFVDGSTNHVRLYKTSSTQLPTPLSRFQAGESSEGLPQVAPSLKIMRRLGADGNLAYSGSNTNSNSMVPSKATSEGSELGDGLTSPAESSTNKDKASQSREQREAKYKEARERIFADWKEDNEKDLSTNASAEASRASSVSGKRKKKKTRDQDDDFEARSAFYRQQPFDPSGASGGYLVPYMVAAGPSIMPQPYNPMLQAQYPVMHQTQMIPTGMISPQNGPIMYQQPVAPQYGTYAIPQQQMMTTYYQVVAQPAQAPLNYPQQYIQANYPQPPMQMARQESQMSDQGWNQVPPQNQFPTYVNHQGQYPPQAPQPIPTLNPNGTSMPYAYGQLPYQPNSPNNRNAHPLPGSYNRQSFNPQARVPSGPIPAVNTLQQNQFAYQQQMPMQSQQTQYMTPAYGSPNISSNSSRKSAAYNMHTPPSSTISKWGTPSTLPPKPPPPATTQMHDPGLPGRKTNSISTTSRHAA